jgi:hypothetical protein
MPPRHSTRATLTALALAAWLAGCGGDVADDSRNPASVDDGRSQALKGGGDCTGSCTGGGGTPVVGTNPLPTSAPAPGTKQLPPPSRGSQRTRPPWRSAICRTSARPRPTPPAFSAWPGRRKKGRRCARGRPRARRGRGRRRAPRPAPCRRATLSFDLAAAVAAGVLQQVAQRAAQQALVALQLHASPLHRRPHARRLFGQPAQQVDRLVRRSSAGRRRPAGWPAAPLRPARRVRRCWCRSRAARPRAARGRVFQHRTAIFSRASGERSSWLALASRLLWERTSASMRVRRG